eukprot:m.60709 g.60709  ORF g.60709 m.60709 type:complete len:267 (+) comp22872_c1_seq1:84-884(+)
MSTSEQQTVKIPLEVGYWAIRGLGAPCRMMVMYAGEPLKAMCYECKPIKEGGFCKKSWFDAKPTFREKNPLVNLPYVYDEENEILVTQTNAVLQFLGRRFSMLGKTEKETAACEQLLAEVMDIRNDMVKHAYGGNLEAWQQCIATRKGDSGFNSFKKLEDWLAAKECKDFFVGSSATAPDFHIWEMCDQHAQMQAFIEAEDLFATMPCLGAFHKSFAKLPQNAKYFESKLSKLPFNNTFAKFGGTPAMVPFEKFEDFTWGGASGVY